MHLSDAHHSRKVVAGACMVVAPILLLVAMVIHPASDMDEATQVATIADNLDAWYTAHLLALVSIAVTVPALLGLMHMLREREVTLGHVGQLVGNGDTDAAVSLLKGLNETAGIVIPFVVVSFGFSIGMALVAVGLYRARAVQSWMAVCVGVGSILFGFGIATAMNWLTIVAAAFLVVGLGSIGRMVLRETDEAWEHTPEYEGFRPVQGMR